MTEKTLTTENIKPALDALRGELAPWPVVAKKQDRLNAAQLNAANSGITSGLVAQIIANTAAIRALESAITGTGLRPLVVASLPAIGTQGILYIVPVTTYDPETDADVVNYSNEYIWIVAPDAPVTEGYYEQVGQTGIVINNGQLTITVNGTSVGTFTANQSGDTTAAITVPTNADYVDRTTDQTVAGNKTFSSTINGTASKAIADEDGTSIKTGYGKLAGNQTWTGVNTFNSAPSIKGYASIINDSMNLGTVPSSTLYNGYWFKGSTSDLIGSTDIEWYSSGNSAIVTRLTRNTAGASREIAYSFVFPQTGNGTFRVYGDCTPSVTNTYSLGSSSYQWSAVYAQSYYYNGTQWGLDQANTWTGYNAFTNYIALQESAVIPAGGYGKGIAFRDYQNNRFGYIQPYLTPASEKRLLIGVDSGDIASNSNIIPNVNNAVNLGSSSYQWSSVYAQSYYYNRTAWGLDKANVWTGVNTFRIATAEGVAVKYTTYKGAILFRTNGVSAFKNYNTFLKWNINGYDNTFGLYRSIGVLGDTTTGATDEDIDTSFSLWKAHIRSKSLDFTDSVKVTNDGTENSLKPITTNATDLGTSTNKWKTLNGVNPGALSLPNSPGGSGTVNINYIDLSGDITIRDASSANFYTAICDGWIAINSYATWIQIADDTTLVCVTGAIGADGFGQCYLPVRKNDSIRIVINQTNTNFQSFKLIPCQGNV